MVLSDVDRHAIEVIFKEKGWSAERIIEEFPGRVWKRSTIRDLIPKIKGTGTSDRREGSGRPRTARTTENLEGDFYGFHHQVYRSLP